MKNVLNPNPLKARKLILALCLAVLSLQSSFVLPALAVTTSSSLSADSEKKLGSYEEVIWGLPKTGQTNEARLDAIEEKLFGKSKNGDAQTRLAEISRAISYGSASATGESALQAIAPSLDKEPVQAAPFYDVQRDAIDASTAALSSAMQLYQDGRIDDAKRALVALTNRDNKNFDAFFNLGVIAEGQGDGKEALEYYRRALAIRPTDTEARQAVDNLSTSVAASSENLRKMVSDASGYYRSGNYDGAISLLERVAGETPKDADVQFALSQAYRGKGNTAGARNALNKAVALAPQNTTYREALSQLNAPAGATNSYNNTNSYNSAAYTPSYSQSPEGRIVPFSGARADSSGARAASEEFASGNYGSNYSYSSTASKTGTRLRRAFTYGLAGAAGSALVTSMFGRNSYNNSRNVRNAAIGGAVVGGLLGLFK